MWFLGRQLRGKMKKVKQMGIKIGLPDARARDYVIAVFICQV
jgi:hypothetical protein